jgi:hypothetical protein
MADKCEDREIFPEPSRRPFLPALEEREDACHHSYISWAEFCGQTGGCTFWREYGGCTLSSVERKEKNKSEKILGGRSDFCEKSVIPRVSFGRKRPIESSQGEGVERRELTRPQNVPKEDNTEPCLFRRAKAIRSHSMICGPAA